jgi:hypothetical protein
MSLFEIILNYIKPPIEIKKNSVIIKKESASNAADEALRKLFTK